MSDQEHGVLTQQQASSSSCSSSSTAAKRKREGGGGEGGSNLLLAGYMAHEFLSRGTILGRRWGPAGDSSPPPSEPARGVVGEEGIGSDSPPLLQKQRYVEVTTLLKTAHLPGIVNPTQLARWIQM